MKSKQNEHNKSENNGGDKKDEVMWHKTQESKENDTNFWKSRNETKCGEYVLSHPPKKPGGTEVFGGTKNLSLRNNVGNEGCNRGVLFLLVWWRVICGLYKKVQYVVQKRKVGHLNSSRTFGLDCTPGEQENAMVQTSEDHNYPLQKTETQSKLEDDTDPEENISVNSLTRKERTVISCDGTKQNGSQTMMLTNLHIFKAI